jgi:hypothetical protein
MKCQMRATDGGHVVTSVTMAMMASFERAGILRDAHMMGDGNVRRFWRLEDVREPWK